MEESEESRRWVTVREIREHFSLDISASSAISGFLQRNYSGTYMSFPYRVERIERVLIDARPHPQTIKKYLIAKRPGTMRKRLPRAEPDQIPEIHVQIFTDHDAVEHFDRVLRIKYAQENMQE
ncbi:MAG: hypothetical protein A4E33_00531 [Methanoregula sp. PtaB.Bin085]|nr:MAG: hypothetical protein A4E33_00531 [Methanoregula sp. PtaB.Bin085]